MSQHYDSHEYANIFPLHDGPAMWELREDIRKNGLQEPIVLYQGKVLDGRRRQVCCIAVEKPMTFRHFKGTDEEALAFVISMNLARRHLGEAERAMVAATVATLKDGRPKTPPNGEVFNSAAANTGKTRAVAAEMLNVSERSVDRAKVVMEHGTPELQEAVKEGTVSLSDAATVSKQPPAIQEKAIKAVRKKKAKTASEAVKREIGDEPKEETTEETMTRVNGEIESFCRKLMSFAEENCPKDRWLDDMNRREGALRKIKDACTTLRSCKCAGTCPRCEGTGKNCRACHATGRMPKQNLEAL